ncbi:MAG: hypothetical protein FWD69_19110, partial [Polyangiaceae bacterium]|nr:hypothetical protein [Polyangiaceae bacterium]
SLGASLDGFHDAPSAISLTHLATNSLLASNASAKISAVVLIWPFSRVCGVGGNVPETAYRSSVDHARSACSTHAHSQVG